MIASQAKMNLYGGAFLLSVLALCSPQTEEEWMVWMQEHKKVYTDRPEEQFCKAIWTENYQKIRDHNNDGGHGYALGLNEFADMVSRKEFCQ